MLKSDKSLQEGETHAAHLKKTQVTIRLDEVTVAWFKTLASETGMPYQTLINLYLRDCAVKERRLNMKWRSKR